MRVWHWAIVVTLLLFAFGVRLEKTAVLGLQADEGVHLFAAERVAAGDVLYTDLFENRTPGVEWLLAGVFKLTGAHFFIGRVLTVLAASLTIAGLVAAGKAAFLRVNKQVGIYAGIIAALLFTIAPLPIFWSRYTMLEPFETAAATLSIVCVLIGIQAQKMRWWGAAGFFVALAVVFKQPGFVLIPLHAGLIGWLLLRRQISVKALGAWVVGGLFVAGVVTAVFLIQGSGADFFQLLSGADRLSPLAGFSQKMARWGGWMLRQPALLLASISIVFVLWQRRASFLFVLGWAVIEIVTLFLPPEFEFGWGGFSHYVFPVVASVSLLAGVGVVLGWQLLIRWRGGRAVGGAALLAVLIVVLPAWAGDFQFVLREADYPQPNNLEEKAIGRAVSLVTDVDQPIVVFGNGGFYYWANRKQASRFFHVPGYLAESNLADEANESLAAALGHSETGAVLASRKHFQNRITQPVMDALWNEWMPVHLFSYPYQDDVILFMRRPVLRGQAPVAVFESGVELTAVHTQNLSNEALLVQLLWLPTVAQDVNYIVFVHLLDADGSLVAQSDSVPMAGFAPVSSWRENTAVFDWHWISLPQNVNDIEDMTLSIGLYLPENGKRLLIQQASGAADAYQTPVEP